MGKSDQKTARTMISNESNRNNSQMGNFNTQLQLERNNAVNQATTQNDAIWSGMGKMAGDSYGGLNSDVIKNLRNGYDVTGMGTPSGGGGGGGGGGGSNVSGGFGESYAGYKNLANGGGVDANRMRAGEGTFRELMNNGGYSDARLAQVNDAIAGLTAMGKTGGLDDTAINRFRGNGIYDEFGNTGGWSAADKANYRSRNNAAMAANFGAANRQAQRAAAVSGGMGGGNLAAALAKSARQNAYGVGQANRESELGLMDAINKGRQWGAEGMTSAENALQTLLTGNKLKGLQGAGDMGINLQNSINTGKNMGASGITDMERGVQSLIQNGVIAGLGGMSNIAGMEAQLAESAAARGAAASAAERARQDANERWIGEMAMQGNQFGLRGMADQYQATPGLLSMYNKDILSGMGLQANTNAGLIGSQNQLASMPGTFGTIMNGIGGVTSGIGGLMSGIGSFSKPGRKIAGGG